MFTDQWVTPTRAGQAAETLLGFLEKDTTGLCHVASASCVTPCAFGEVIADHVGSSEELLTERSIDDIKREATPPPYSYLDVDKLETALGRLQLSLRADIKTV